MRLEQIGTLTLHPHYWLLVYDRCGHEQVLARWGLEEFHQVTRDVRRYYAECLTCRRKAQ